MWNNLPTVSHRSDDGSAGDADYGQVGGAYSQYRRPDPRIAARIVDALGDARPVPLDCVDGFNEAYYGRPEMLLDPAARLSCSAWSFVGAAVQDRFTVDLSRDLADGTWDRRFGHLRTQPTFDGSLVLVVSRP